MSSVVLVEVPLLEGGLHGLDLTVVSRVRLDPFLA
jgi:hypothetical protein